MSKSIEQAITALRADLMATNTAVLALLRTMTPEQRERCLEAFAQMSAQKQSFVEAAPSPTQRQLLTQIQEAEARLHQAMQGAHKVQTAQDKPG